MDSLHSPLDLPPRLLIAVGGNAIHPEGIRGTAEEQMQTAARAARTLLPILELERELIVTHGNGPGVGKTIMRQVLARHRVTPMSLDICVANTQGVTAYLLMQALYLRHSMSTDQIMHCLLKQILKFPNQFLLLLGL